MDLDADAKLNLREFIDGVRPLENFCPSNAKKVRRPKTAITLDRPETRGEVRTVRKEDLDYVGRA